MIKGIVFDFDGVILESVAVKDQAIFDLFRNESQQVRQRVLDLHRDTPGINRRSRLELLLTKGLGKEHVTAREVDALLQQFSELIWQGLLNCPEVPGVRKFLEDLPDIPCYVASAGPGQEVQTLARERNFLQYFEDILGAPRKKPDMLQEIVAGEQVSAKNILFIGDKISDYHAAHQAGTAFLGRKTAHNPTAFPDNVPVITDFTPGRTYLLHELIYNSQHH